MNNQCWACLPFLQFLFDSASSVEGMLLLVATVLCAVAMRSSEAVLDSVDLLEPIVRTSPAKGMKEDMFGMSFAVHQYFSNSNGLTREQALEQTE